jgi:hypothetical protein
VLSLGIKGMGMNEQALRLKTLARFERKSAITRPDNQSRGLQAVINDIQEELRTGKITPMDQLVEKSRAKHQQGN